MGRTARPEQDNGAHEDDMRLMGAETGKPIRARRISGEHDAAGLRVGYRYKCTASTGGTEDEKLNVTVDFVEFPENRHLMPPLLRVAS